MRPAFVLPRRAVSVDFKTLELLLGSIIRAVVLEHLRQPLVGLNG